MKKYILKFKYRFLLICFLILLRQLFLMKSNFLNADAITVLTNRNLHSFFEIILFLSVTWIVIIVIDRVVKVREETFIQDIGIDVKDNLSTNLIELDIEKYKDLKEEIFIIGGGEIYKKSLEMGIIKRIYMSHVDFSDNEADAYFPKIDLDKWITLTEENHNGWKFCIYEKFNG